MSTLIAQRLPRDAVLLGLSTLLALIIGVPMGIYQALQHGTVRDDVRRRTWFTLYSAPDFMEALLLIAIFSVHFHILQPDFPGGITSVGGLFADLNALVLPVRRARRSTASPSFSQYMRSSAIEELAQDYIRTARAKGLRERLILTRHVLRNALLPIVTILGLSLPDIVAGARDRGGHLQLPRHGPAVLAVGPQPRLPGHAGRDADHRRGHRGRATSPPTSPTASSIPGSAMQSPDVAAIAGAADRRCLPEGGEVAAPIGGRATSSLTTSCTTSAPWAAAASCCCWSCSASSGR